MRVAMQRQEWEHACCNLEVPTHIQPPLYSFSLSIMSYLLSISSAQARLWAQRQRELQSLSLGNSSSPGEQDTAKEKSLEWRKLSEEGLHR